LYSVRGNWRKAFWSGISRFFFISAKSTRKHVLSPGKGGCPPRYPQSDPQSGRWGRAPGTARGVSCAGSITQAIRRPRPGQADERDVRKGRIRKRGPSMYEMEGPRRGQLAGPPIARLPGVLSDHSTGGGKSARKASFPAFCTPAQTFRFPGAMECGGPADLRTWWCRISTAYPQGGARVFCYEITDFVVMNSFSTSVAWLSPGTSRCPPGCPQTGPQTGQSVARGKGRCERACTSA
jgi:hypothetical protein